MRVIFTHIPKTAGSSVHEGAASIVGFKRMHIVPTDNDDIGNLQERKSDVLYVGGHIRFPIASEVFGEEIYVTSLRDPVERILSNFFFAIREGGLGKEILKNGARDGFVKFYEMVIKGPGRINLQCRFLSNERVYESALDVLEKQYVLAWDTDKTDLAWPIIKALIKKSPEEFPISIKREELIGVAPLASRAFAAPISPDPGAFLCGARPENYRDFLDAEIIEQIEEDNAEDVKLYAWIKERGGLFINENKLKPDLPA